MNVAQFMIDNGPVAFNSLKRAPRPPQTAALGAINDLVPVDKTDGKIGAILGFTSTGLAITSAVMNKPRTKAIIRSVGCIGLTFVYLATADK